MTQCRKTTNEYVISLNGHRIGMRREEIEECKDENNAFVLSRGYCPNNQIGLHAIIHKEETSTNQTTQTTFFLTKVQVLARIRELLQINKSALIHQIPDLDGDGIPETAFFFEGQPHKNQTSFSFPEAGISFHLLGHLFQGHESCENTSVETLHFSAILMSSAEGPSQLTSLFESSREESCQTLTEPSPPLCLPSNSSPVIPNHINIII